MSHSSCTITCYALHIKRQREYRYKRGKEALLEIWRASIIDIAGFTLIYDCSLTQIIFYDEYLK